jgi:hypothetical protein
MPLVAAGYGPAAMARGDVFPPGRLAPGLAFLDRERDAADPAVAPPEHREIVGETVGARGSIALVPASADAALALLPRLAGDRMPLVAAGSRRRAARAS